MRTLTDEQIREYFRELYKAAGLDFDTNLDSVKEIIIMSYRRGYENGYNQGHLDTCNQIPKVLDEMSKAKKHETFV